MDASYIPKPRKRPSSAGSLVSRLGFGFTPRVEPVREGDTFQPNPEQQQQQPLRPFRSSSFSISPHRVKQLTPLSSNFDRQASELILNAVGRNNIDVPTSAKRVVDPPPSASPPSKRSSFGSMLNFTSLSLSREKSNLPALDEKETTKEKDAPTRRPRSSSTGPRDEDTNRSSRSRARSSSPFLRRLSARDPSPAVEALRLSQSDAELSESDETNPPKPRSDRRFNIIPRRSAFSKRGADDESSSGDSSDSDDDSLTNANIHPDTDQIANDSASAYWFDQLTERNTEQNVLLTRDADGQPLYMTQEETETDDMTPDPLGEGVNVVRPEEPLFPPSSPAPGRGRGIRPNTTGSTSASASPARNARKKKSLHRSDRLELHTSRPTFQRDRCTVVLTHGDPEGYLANTIDSKRREPKRYVVASDLSVESGYAIEWGIGTVLRDGDTMILVSVQETDSKLDPEPNAPAPDRVSKLKNQQERSALAFLLVRQVISLLQRTKLQCTVICQAIHAKNSRRMLVDLIDYTEPTMVIVGSRGLGQLKGILLGSTSHYLIQKSSVPVMVARRRLKRPAKHTAHLASSIKNNEKHRKLSEAIIDKTGPGRLDHDVESMREEIEREETEEVAMKRRGMKGGRG